MVRVSCFSWTTVIAVSRHYMSASANIHPKGVLVSYADIPFFVDPEPVATLPNNVRLDTIFPVSDDVKPVILIGTTKAGFNDEDLRSTITSYLSSDDVLNESFLQAIIIYTKDGGSISITAGCGYSTIVASVPRSFDIPDGPYIISSRTMDLYIPYRLYPDTHGAFTTGVISKPDGSYTTLPVAIPGAASITIAVASRLYYTPSPQMPLKGVRIGVKDIYDLNGIKTGAGSRAYYETYPAANATAVAVQRLVDAGAMVVGKMKTTQFAAPEFARDAIDYQAPFNARADGYQEVGSSSSGPGGGMSSYSWLDLALGSDTGGSVRVPAQYNGVYGNRPSYGHVDLTNVVPLGPEYDTAGFLARDPEIWRTATKVLYTDLTSTYSTYPKFVQTIGLKDKTAPDLTPADHVIVDWLDRFSSYLHAEVIVLNYTSRWIESHPPNTSADLFAFLNTTWTGVCAPKQSRLVRDPFFKEYAALHDGRRPYVNPPTRAMWDWSLTQPPTLLHDSLTQKQLFMKWWNTEILSPDPKTCSDSLIIYIGSDALGVTGEPSYRDAPGPHIGILTGLLGGLFISPFAEIPDFVVPIGQVPYHSTVTMQQEYLPVTIDIMAAKGCDLMLMDLINDLVGVGILSEVATGRSIYAEESHAEYRAFETPGVVVHNEL